MPAPYKNTCKEKFSSIDSSKVVRLDRRQKVVTIILLPVCILRDLYARKIKVCQIIG